MRIRMRMRMMSCREYLSDPTKYLDTKIQPMGYNTCHQLHSSLDASVCAQDCARLEGEPFAADCRAKGGLFKCCLRRDAAFCHECRSGLVKGGIVLGRFCCTLAMCSFRPNVYRRPGTSNTVFDEKVCVTNHGSVFLLSTKNYRKWS
jgi:hypothetical protein